MLGKMCAYDVRDATSDDKAFIREMAERFGRGDDPEVFEGFGKTRWDFGVVATIDDQSIGAAWCRRVTRPKIAGTDQPFGVAPSTNYREPFLGVRPEVERQGIGTFLLDTLIQRARQERGVHCLVATPGPDHAKRMMLELGFKEPSSNGGRWMLMVRG